MQVTFSMLEIYNEQVIVSLHFDTQMLATL